jgi:transposase-like protein
MFSRWKHDKPMSRGEFYSRFPDDAACADYMAAERWPDGFKCPACAAGGWELRSKRFTWECVGCHRQTSVTAGTAMHRSKVGLRKWFELIHMMTSHSNGISAEQAHRALGLGSYNTAWLMLQKLRRAMVDPERSKLAGRVEVDETTVPYRTVHDPVAGGQGRSLVGKLPIICAVELSEDGQPRRIRLAPIGDYGRDTLHAFVKANVAPGAVVFTDGNPSYLGLDYEPEHYDHRPKVVGKMAAHILLKWVHRAISNMKRWFIGTLHGVRKPHLQRYLDEFVFRWNRRRHFSSAFTGLVGFAARITPATMRQIVDHTA